jgi:hypothetical protein
MTEWIKKTVNPPGVNKPGRFALFSVIGAVADKVRSDALKAFNAHFPYLADEAKLEEHGAALLIPHLLDDTEKEYRERVAAASFFLMKAGERSYVLNQLGAHFGSRYVAKEEFLKLYVKILEISDADREWVHGFLDGLLDPNIELTVADWFRFVEEFLSEETQRVAVTREDFDQWPGSLRCDGRFYCDQGAQNVCDGGFACGGEADCSGWRYERGTISDTVFRSVSCDGEIICNGEAACSGFRVIYDPLEVPDPVLPKAEGGVDAAGPLALVMEPESEDASFEDAFVLITIIRRACCDGTRTPMCVLCDGSMVCDGSYSGFDGWVCEEVIEEELV